MLGAILMLGAARLAFAFPADCPNVTVIHDVVGDKWYDGCLGLVKKETVLTSAACEEQCHADMTCSVWQMIKNTADKEICWSGSVVHGCRSRGSDAALGNFEGDLMAGQRIQHGFIKVVAVNSKVETVGLKHFPEVTGTDAEKTARCKQFCYTDTTCTVWQYGKDGCWVEHLPTNPMGAQKTDTEWAAGMIAGETIEHTCPVYEAPIEVPMAWVLAGAFMLMCYCCCPCVGVVALVALVYFLVKKTPKVKKTRAVKIEPKEEVLVPLFIPQPTMLIPQPTMLIQQPSMVMAPQPQYTMVPQSAPMLVPQSAPMLYR